MDLIKTKEKRSSEKGSSFFSYTSYIFLCFFILIFTSCESAKVIVNNLEEKEANEIIVFLAGKGIDAQKMAKESGGGGGDKIALYNIQVTETKSVVAMAFLNQAGLPRRKSQDLLGLFSAGGLVPSELEEKIRYQSGLAEQIASTIRKIDGIIDADVRLSFPKEDPLNPEATKGIVSASVFIKHQGVMDDQNAHLSTKIQRLVASSITELNYNDVTVVAYKARYSDITLKDGSVLGSQDLEYTKVWSIILAKDSLTIFRIIFFSFISFIILLGAIVVWMTWKCYPIIVKGGGVQEFFALHPYTLELLLEREKKEAQEAKEGEEKEKTEAKEGEEKGDKEAEVKEGEEEGDKEEAAEGEAEKEEDSESPENPKTE